MKRYWFRHCPLCKEEGDLVIHKDSKSARLYLECDECTRLWFDPAESSELDKGVFSFDLDIEPTIAGLEDIRQKGWEQYALNSYDF